MKKYLNGVIAKQTEKTIEKIQEDTEKDNFMIVEEALEYGIRNSRSYFYKQRNADKGFLKLYFRIKIKL